MLYDLVTFSRGGGGVLSFYDDIIKFVEEFVFGEETFETNSQKHCAKILANNTVGCYKYDRVTVSLSRPSVEAELKCGDGLNKVAYNARFCIKLEGKTTMF